MSRVFRVNKSPNDALALSNCVIVSPRDFDPKIQFILLDDTFAFTIRPFEGIAPGELGTSLFHRRFASLSLNQEVKVRQFDPYEDGPHAFIGSVQFQLSYLRRGFDSAETFDAAELSKVVHANFNGQVFTAGQPFCFDFHGITLAVTVSFMDNVDLETIRNQPAELPRPIPSGTGVRGVMTEKTTIHFAKAPDSTIRLTGLHASKQPKQLFAGNFNFEELGIGGLDKEFGSIFRRAFASRTLPPEMLEKLGIQHVKGLILYGPPGTGKTLMARRIGQMLNVKQENLKVVNGPEVLSKFVGQSEENVRNLFANAEADYKKNGEAADLHIIIFDELDAICRQRGTKNDGTGTGDSVVNQLLSKMDGVDQLNNILIIGMTNRLDMIDEALLRPGRLEVHMEVSLPDEHGRLQILNIHTKKIKEQNALDNDVDLLELAQLTKNFSGAEIAGLVKSASSFAYNRHVKLGKTVTVTDLDKLKVTRDDFLSALNEVHPSYGVAEKELEPCVQNGIIRFNSNIEHILQDGQLYYNQVRTSERTPLVSVLLHGPPGSGKTALAATIANNSEFPFVKLISPENMVGYSEPAKINQINKVFSDAYKSPLSVIIVDGIERLLDWVPIGPRFSNGVLQTLMVLIKKQPPKGRKLLILATTSQSRILEEMDMLNDFNANIYVGNLRDVQSELAIVLQELQLFKAQGELNSVLMEISNRIAERATASKKVNLVAPEFDIGIKKVIMIAEMARQDVDAGQKFVQAITEEALSAALPAAALAGSRSVLQRAYDNEGTTRQLVQDLRNDFKI